VGNGARRFRFKPFSRPSQHRSRREARRAEPGAQSRLPESALVGAGICRRREARRAEPGAQFCLPESARFARWSGRRDLKPNAAKELRKLTQSSFNEAAQRDPQVREVSSAGEPGTFRDDSIAPVVDVLEAALADAQRTAAAAAAAGVWDVARSATANAAALLGRLDARCDSRGGATVVELDSERERRRAPRPVR
jgi:hypothetical protein